MHRTTLAPSRQEIEGSTPPARRLLAYHHHVPGRPFLVRAGWVNGPGGKPRDQPQYPGGTLFEWEDRPNPITTDPGCDTGPVEVSTTSRGPGACRTLRSDGVVTHRHPRRLEATGVNLRDRRGTAPAPVPAHLAAASDARDKPAKPVADNYDLPDEGGVGGVGHVWLGRCWEGYRESAACDVFGLNLDANG